MSYEVLVSNPTEPSETALCEAVIDLGPGRPKVPAEIYERLALPGWARLEFRGCSTHMSVEPSNDGLLHIPLAMLTALGLEFNRTTGELTPVEFLLLSMYESKSS